MKQVKYFLLASAIIISSFSNLSQAIPIVGPDGETKPVTNNTLDFNSVTRAPYSNTERRTKVKKTNKELLLMNSIKGPYYGPTRADETLWNISTRIRPNKNVSIAQVALATFNLNSLNFENNNIHQLKPNSTLTVPTLSQIKSVTTAQATARLKADEHRTVGTPPKTVYPIAHTNESNPNAPVNATDSQINTTVAKETATTPIATDTPLTENNSAIVDKTEPAPKTEPIETAQSTTEPLNNATDNSNVTGTTQPVENENTVDTDAPSSATAAVATVTTKTSDSHSEDGSSSSEQQAQNQPKPTDDQMVDSQPVVTQEPNSTLATTTETATAETDTTATTTDDAQSETSEASKAINTTTHLQLPVSEQPKIDVQTERKIAELQLNSDLKAQQAEKLTQKLKAEQQKNEELANQLRKVEEEKQEAALKKQNNSFFTEILSKPLYLLALAAIPLLLIIMLIIMISRGRSQKKELELDNETLSKFENNQLEPDLNIDHDNFDIDLESDFSKQNSASLSTTPQSLTEADQSKLFSDSKHIKADDLSFDDDDDDDIVDLTFGHEYSGQENEKKNNLEHNLENSAKGQLQNAQETASFAAMLNQQITSEQAKKTDRAEIETETLDFDDHLFGESDLQHTSFYEESHKDVSDMLTSINHKESLLDDTDNSELFGKSDRSRTLSNNEGQDASLGFDNELTIADSNYHELLQEQNNEGRTQFTIDDLPTFGEDEASEALTAEENGTYGFDNEIDNTGIQDHFTPEQNIKYQEVTQTVQQQLEYLEAATHRLEKNDLTPNVDADNIILPSTETDSLSDMDLDLDKLLDDSELIDPIHETESFWKDYNDNNVDIATEEWPPQPELHNQQSEEPLLDDLQKLFNEPLPEVISELIPNEYDPEKTAVDHLNKLDSEGIDIESLMADHSDNTNNKKY